MKTGRDEEVGGRYTVRELRPADLKGLLEALSNLSETGLTPEAARGILAKMKGNPAYHVFVAVTRRGEVIGATTLLVEQKFIHRGGMVGHIEDVSVKRGHEGKGVGSSVVGAAVEKARQLGCYKVILDCRADLVGFYKKLGFRENEVGMRLDLTR